MEHMAWWAVPPVVICCSWAYAQKTSLWFIFLNVRIWGFSPFLNDIKLKIDFGQGVIWTYQPDRLEVLWLFFFFLIHFILTRHGFSLEIHISSTHFHSSCTDMILQEKNWCNQQLQDGCEKRIRTFIYMINNTLLQLKMPAMIVHCLFFRFVNGSVVNVCSYINVPKSQAPYTVWQQQTHNMINCTLSKIRSSLIRIKKKHYFCEAVIAYDWIYSNLLFYISSAVAIQSNASIFPAKVSWKRVAFKK